MKIERISDGTYSVHSNSGGIYQITYEGCGDGDSEYVALWVCDCPGYGYRGTCRHLKEFLSHIDKYVDMD